MASNIKEFKYKRHAKRAIERSTIIGQRGAKYTVVGCSIITPTLEYPDVVISFSLSNGANYTYSQISPQEFDNLISTLQAWRDQFMGIMPDLEAKSEVAKAQREAYDQQLRQVEEAQAQVRMLQQQMGTMGDE